jgi:hypothetical protein
MKIRCTQGQLKGTDATKWWQGQGQQGNITPPRTSMKSSMLDLSWICQSRSVKSFWWPHLESSQEIQAADSHLLPPWLSIQHQSALGRYKTAGQRGLQPGALARLLLRVLWVFGGGNFPWGKTEKFQGKVQVDCYEGTKAYLIYGVSQNKPLWQNVSSMFHFDHCFICEYRLCSGA